MLVRSRGSSGREPTFLASVVLRQSLTHERSFATPHSITLHAAMVLIFMRACSSLQEVDRRVRRGINSG